ncbi:MAG TPA: PQQ-dependent sugar dehydrogenase [Candidatus Saccharimonadales bacterium]|nr:PQQ-dependent sugar dehydrogenase [Candidatus Saccharimonadales bacterium]
MAKRSVTKNKVLAYIVLFELLAIAGILLWLAVFSGPRTTTLVSTREPVPVTYNSPRLGLTLFASGLHAPVDITSLPASAKDNRLFVVEQAGTIRTIDAKGAVATQPFMDITNKVKAGGEMGLLGMAFDPSFAKNGYIYVDYIDQTMNTVVSRFTTNKQTGTIDTSSEKILLTQKQPYQNHNGGAVRFGPDGYLYIAFGDGGSAGDPENYAQNKNSWLGKLLRVDVHTGTPYKVPATNPFVGQANVKPEIWALGLRNPWRISFDRKTGDLYIADVGQGTIEEIDVQSRISKGGENYGWRCYEGAHAYNTTDCPSASSFVMPVLTYDHTGGRCSITGGNVYRGSSQKALKGAYIYADFCTGELYYAKKAKSTWQTTLAQDTAYKISTFGEDSAGELYTADLPSGTLYRIVDTAH